MPYRRYPRDIPSSFCTSALPFLNPSGLAGTPATRPPGGTSLLTTAPAAVRAPAPTFTGAISRLSLPMKAPSPITVSCLNFLIEVARDGACSDVGARADHGVADVAEVADVRSRADAARLDFNVRADVRGLLQY